MFSPTPTASAARGLEDKGCNARPKLGLHASNDVYD